MLGIRNDHSSTVKKQPMFANKNQNAKSANQIRRSISSSAQQPILKVGSFSSANKCSDSFTILGLWVLGLAVSNINESQLQTYESKTLFLMTSLQYLFIPGLAEIKLLRKRCRMHR